MSQTDARFHISLSGGTFDVSGSEEFVREQMREHSGVIEVLLGKLKEGEVGTAHNSHGTGPAATPAAGASSNGRGDSGGTGAAAGDASDSYPNVFSISGEEVRIISDLPGQSDKEKSINAALLYLLAKESTGGKRAGFAEIQEICRSHACLNMGNFSKYLKSAKRDLNVYGSGRNHEAELTHPGRKAAQALAQQLNAE